MLESLQLSLPVAAAVVLLVVVVVVIFVGVVVVKRVGCCPGSQQAALASSFKPVETRTLRSAESLHIQS